MGKSAAQGREVMEWFCHPEMCEYDFMGRIFWVLLFLVIHLRAG